MAKGGDGRAVLPSDNQNVSAEQLRSFVERIERMEEERRTIGEDIKQIKLESKAAGFDNKVIAFLIRERRKNRDDINEFNAILGIYKRALGMESDL